MMTFRQLLSTSLTKKKWFITGGAGFIGSHVVDLLVSSGCHVTVYDNLRSGNIHYLEKYIKDKKIIFIRDTLSHAHAVRSAMSGHDIVWHLAANTDVPGGYKKHRIDLDNDVVATYNVLEAMVKNNIADILFSSTGAVYGESIKGIFRESSGPLIPVSLYGAGKIGSEAFIDAYCSLFGIRAWIFRFGNVIGERITHGIIYDFIEKLKKEKKTLEILGKGRGEKNYFLVEECIHGMLYTYQKLPHGPFPVLVNLGTDSTTKVMEIAHIIIEEVGLQNIQFRFSGGERSWPGDQPVVLLDTTKIHTLGWYARHTSDEAVRMATRRLLGKDTFLLSVKTII